MLRIIGVILTLTIAVGTLGCGSPVNEETIEVKASNDPLHEPRSILQRYAEGQPMGSEASTFPDMVARVEKIDPTRAAVLRDGLAEIEATAPPARAGKAKELLEKLQPSMQ